MVKKKMIIETDINGEAFMAVNEPQPCGKFKKSPLGEWIKKLSEETAEVYEAAAAYEATRLSEGLPLRDFDGDRESAAWNLLGQEIADVITVCHSMFYAYGFKADDIAELFLMTNIKNGKRGYLMGEDDEKAEA